MSPRPSQKQLLRANCQPGNVNQTANVSILYKTTNMPGPAEQSDIMMVDPVDPKVRQEFIQWLNRKDNRNRYRLYPQNVAELKRFLLNPELPALASLPEEPEQDGIQSEKGRWSITETAKVRTNTDIYINPSAQLPN